MWYNYFDFCFVKGDQFIVSLTFEWDTIMMCHTITLPPTPTPKKKNNNNK